MKYQAVIVHSSYLYSLGLAVELRQRKFFVAVHSKKPEIFENEVLYFLEQNIVSGEEQERDNIVLIYEEAVDGKFFQGASYRNVNYLLDEIVDQFTKKTNREILTERQEEILQGILEGKTNREIGVQLFLSEKTIKNNITDLYQTLKVKNRQEVFSKFGHFFRNV